MGSTEVVCATTVDDVRVPVTVLPPVTLVNVVMTSCVALVVICFRDAELVLTAEDETTVAVDLLWVRLEVEVENTVDTSAEETWDEDSVNVDVTPTIDVGATDCCDWDWISVVVLEGRILVTEVSLLLCRLNRFKALSKASAAANDDSKKVRRTMIANRRMVKKDSYSQSKLTESKLNARNCATR